MAELLELFCAEMTKRGISWHIEGADVGKNVVLEITVGAVLHQMRVNFDQDGKITGSQVSSAPLTQ